MLGPAPPAMAAAQLDACLERHATTAAGDLKNALLCPCLGYYVFALFQEEK